MNKPKVEQLSQSMFEIKELGHTIKIKKLKGRTILNCSCENSARFANNNFCWHKELVIDHLAKQPISKKLDKLIKLYELAADSKLSQYPEVMLDDLNSLKRLI